jgi:aryl-alcohol dehydrogenase-like predicted oxidoreductase
MLLHYVQEPLREWRGAIDALVRAKRRGDVLAIGLSTHNPRFVREAIDTGVMECVFVTLNVAGTWVEGGGGNGACLPRRSQQANFARRRQAMIDACQAAKRAGLGVVLLKVLGNGALVSQRISALRWAFSRPFADGVIVGVETIAHVRRDLAAVERR